MTDAQWAKHNEEKTIASQRGHIIWVRNEVMKAHENAKTRLRQLLKEVHDKRSYVPDFGTFENYCMKEWKITKARGYQIINGENFRLLLEDAGLDEVDKIPDGQIAELEKVKPKEAVKIIKRIRKNSEKTGKRITAKDIAKEIEPDEVIPPKAELCPHCQRPMPKRRVSHKESLDEAMPD